MGSEVHIDRVLSIATKSILYRGTFQKWAIPVLALLSFNRLKCKEIETIEWIKRQVIWMNASFNLISVYKTRNLISSSATENQDVSRAVTLQRKIRDFSQSRSIFDPGTNSRGGGHLGTFWVGMCRPGLQIGTPFKKKFPLKLIPRSRNKPIFYTPF